MKDRSAEVSRVALDKPHVRGKLAEPTVPLELPCPDPARRVPRQIEWRGLRHCAQPLFHRRLRLHDVEGELEMMVHRLTRDEQPHDLGRAFEDEIDTEIA